MKKHLCVSVMSLCLAQSALAQNMVHRGPSRASDNQIGVGIGFEGATGLSVYKDAWDANFFQANLGWGPGGSYHVSGDYAFGYPGTVAAIPQLTPYWGVGVLAAQRSESYWVPYGNRVVATSDEVGARLPLGVNFVIPRTPVQLSGQLVPTLIATSPSYSYLQGGVSARVLF